MEHPSEETLNDLVDGVLAEELRPAVRDHLERCPACADEVRRIEELVGTLRSLPRRHAPPERVWSRLAGRTVEVERRASRRWWLAAAAGIVLALLAGTLVWQARGPGIAAPGGGGTAGTVAARAGSAGEAMAQARASYEARSRELLAALEESRDQLPVASVEALEESLVALDAAIAGLEAALAEHPGNTALATRTGMAYRQKLELMRNAVRLARADL